MNPFNRTLKFVGVAAGSALLAAVSWYATQPSEVAGFGDIGQEFFTDFDDVTKATSLAVVDYDADQKEVASFSVKQNDDGLWVIPSHHNYPAEAKDRLARTATSLMGVKKTAVQSRSKDDWKRYGVVDPEADGAATADERGTRLTLSDGSGNPLVDLIVGNSVEERSGNYYVRLPDNNTTYVSELDVDLSAKFSDWIEPDLLKISSSDIVKVVLDNYSVNEERGTVEKKELLEFVKEDLKTDGDWKLADLKEDAEEFDNSPVTSIATQLDSLKIVGVRPKPDGLGGNMRVNPAVKQILQMQMQSQGYFIGGDKDGNERLYSNEGELVAGISNGVEYTLYFGEIARGTGKDIEVGLKDEAKAKEEAADKAPDADAEEGEDGPRRYLLVKVDFNQSLLGEKPIPPLEPMMPDILKAADKPVEDKKAVQPDEAGQPADNADADVESDVTEDDADDCGPQDESADEPVKEDPPKQEPPADKKPEAANKEATDPVKPQEAAPAKNDAPKEPAAQEPAKTKAADESKADNATKADEAAKTNEAPKAKEDPTEDPKADDAAKDDDPAPKTAAPAETKTSDDAAADMPATEAPKVADETPTEPAPPKQDPKQLAQQVYDAALASFNSEQSNYETELKAFEAKVEDGQKKVKELTTRFDGWYYVISSDSFEKFRIERKDVVSAKAAEEDKTDEAAAPAGK